MNRNTRKFIWGLIVLLFGVNVVSTQIAKFNSDNPELWNCVYLITGLIAIIDASLKIRKTL